MDKGSPADCHRHASSSLFATAHAAAWRSAGKVPVLHIGNQKITVAVAMSLDMRWTFSCLGFLLNE